MSPRHREAVNVALEAWRAGTALTATAASAGTREPVRLTLTSLQCGSTAWTPGDFGGYSRKAMGTIFAGRPGWQRLLIALGPVDPLGDQRLSLQGGASPFQLTMVGPGLISLAVLAGAFPNPA
jgi:hypothetical protein